jgi:ribosomal protein S18 acetylase RimI-like enzyme
MSNTPMDVTPRGLRPGILVEPSMRRRGLGSRLLRLVARQGGPPGYTFEANCPATWKSGCKFLEAKNFKIAHRTLYMERPSDVLSRVELATGFVIRPYEATSEDDAAWIRLHEDGYRDDYDFTPLTLKGIEAIHGRPDCRLWMLEHQSEIVGFCLAWMGRKTSLIDSIVVDPRFRSRRLGYGLLTKVLQALSDGGAESFELTVNANKKPAFRLYRKLGFETYDEERNYRRSCRFV